MKHLNPLLLAATLVAAASFPAAAQQAPSAETTAGSPGAQASLAEGEVRKVDKSAGKITLKHGEIRSLDMPPMTMVFVAADAAMLEKVKTGDKVRFRAAMQDGKYTVTEIQPAP